MGTKDKQTSLNNFTHSWGSAQSKTLGQASHPSLQGAQRGLPRDWVAASPEAVSVVTEQQEHVTQAREKNAVVHEHMNQ